MRWCRFELVSHQLVEPHVSGATPGKSQNHSITSPDSESAFRGRIVEHYRHRRIDTPHTLQAPHTSSLMEWPASP